MLLKSVNLWPLLFHLLQGTLTSAHFIIDDQIVYPPVIIRHPNEVNRFSDSLKVDGNRVFVTQSTESNVVSFELPCSADGDPPPTYFWKHNGVIIDETYLEKVTYDSTRGPLRFTAFRAEMAGTYQCFASGNPQHGFVAVSDSVLLIPVQYPTEPLRPPDALNITAVLNEYTMLVCDVNLAEFLPPATVDWIDHQNKSVTVGNVYHVIDPEGNLHILSAKTWLNGTVLTCAAYQKESGVTVLGTSVRVEVIEAERNDSDANEAREPALVYPQTGVSLFYFARNSYASVTCIFSGSPAPSVTFHKNSPNSTSLNRAQAGNAVVKDGTLSWTGIQEQDEGVYFCKGCNDGEANWQFEVLVKNPPGQQNLSEVHSAYYNGQVGDRIPVNCSTNADPPLTVTWFKNGFQIELDSVVRDERYSLSDDLLVLTIEEALLLDRSIMQCNVSNDYGYSFFNFYLNISDSSASSDSDEDEKIGTAMLSDASKEGGNTDQIGEQGIQSLADIDWWLLGVSAGVAAGSILVISFFLYLFVAVRYSSCSCQTK